MKLNKSNPPTCSSKDTSRKLEQSWESVLQWKRIFLVCFLFKKKYRKNLFTLPKYVPVFYWKPAHCNYFPLLNNGGKMVSIQRSSINLHICWVEAYLPVSAEQEKKTILSHQFLIVKYRGMG